VAESGDKSLHTLVTIIMGGKVKFEKEQKQKEENKSVKHIVLLSN
jgi:hypothetical protein